jgi:hypothetical protein
MLMSQTNKGSKTAFAQIPSRKELTVILANAGIQKRHQAHPTTHWIPTCGPVDLGNSEDIWLPWI